MALRSWTWTRQRGGDEVANADVDGDVDWVRTAADAVVDGGGDWARAWTGTLWGWTWGTWRTWWTNGVGWEE